MLDKILDFVADQIKTIKSRLGEDSYETKDIGWSGTTWKCPKTCVVTIQANPVQSGFSYFVVKDDTEGHYVLAANNEGTSLALCGQFIALKGHSYTIQERNINGGVYKYTTPTGWGGTVKAVFSRLSDIISSKGVRLNAR